MKRMMLAILFVFALVLSMQIVSANDYNLNARILRYDPIPASPGDYVVVTLELKNNGNEDAPAAAITFEDQFPFTVVRDSDKTKTVGLLKAQQSFVYDVQLRVDSGAIIGENDLRISYTGNTASGFWLDRTFPIDVKSNDASITVTKIETIPEELIPGEDAIIKITIQNTANIPLRNIGVNLNLFATSGTGTLDLPFIPTGSATEKRITRLNADESTVLYFDIKSYPSASPGFYKLPLTTTFYDDAGTKTDKTDIVGVVVQADPELKVILERTTLTGPNSQGEVILKFINKGIHDLKFLDVTVNDGDGYVVLSSRQNYIGDLDSDDYRSESFIIKANNTNLKLDLDISYKDANNKQYENNVLVDVPYNTLIQGNGGGISTGTILFILLLVGVIGYMIRRKIKRNRAHDK